MLWHSAHKTGFSGKRVKGLSANLNLTNLTNMRTFHPLEAVDRGSETQLHVGEN